MPDTYNYPAEIERDEDGRFVVAFPDFGWGATDGATRDEAIYCWAKPRTCCANSSRPRSVTARPCRRRHTLVRGVP